MTNDPDLQRASFLTTRWSIVLTAGAQPSPDQRAALETLCSTYWYPLYAYVRRKGHDADTARDLVQDFFSRLLERNDFARADPEKGRFRAYLLTALKHFLINERERERAEKRGGGKQPLPLEFTTHDAETRFSLEPAIHDAPDRAFDREWALIVLQRALSKLGAEQRAAGKSAAWSLLEPYLTTAENLAPYAALAPQLSVTENAIKITLHRLRQRYGELLRDEIADTLHTQDVDAELATLFDALA
ncbi:MAG: sigma-70 family RNA polymerase sigma factor [Planctomycetes bacterium]|nr:sigma-70 family RNA polymerase sigma factor [Planctomycetota bacterium]